MQNKKPHKKMADRATIFMSFDALKGFREYLKQKERVVVPKKELSEDECEILDWKIHQLEIGKIATVIFYDKTDYIKIEGIVSKIDLEYSKTICIVNKKINLSSIIEIEQ